MDNCGWPCMRVFRPCRGARRGPFGWLVGRRVWGPAAIVLMLAGLRARCLAGWLGGLWRVPWRGRGMRVWGWPWLSIVKILALSSEFLYVKICR